MAERTLLNLVNKVDFEIVRTDKLYNSSGQVVGHRVWVNLCGVSPWPIITAQASGHDKTAAVARNRAVFAAFKMFGNDSLLHENSGKHKTVRI